ncbi:murein transglycosylase [Amycolatopsis taiwanensis]|uniref:Murein transglycosylase n=1 Tax=Amycolatopsis taiwanensis TaxID=342230 RepID=A0A9W6R1I3_9PSEU|nr:murein transglycosylase [Amycolatopsis taiwanensis]
MAGVWGGIAALRDTPQPPRADPPPPFVVPELTPPSRSAIPAAAQIPAERDPWLAYLASATDVPLRALSAYTDAEAKTRATDPGCHVTWATLAGIGRTESHHGNHGNSSLGADGVAFPPVFGPELDGSPGLLAIADTDGGRLDGDPVWDRAAGPMQFLPQTWQKWGMRASGDGAAPDPQNIDDAALTAARYLCDKGGDLANPAGWWGAVLTYNNSVAYGQEVFSNADAYARAALKP